jgi:hypothetical protein
MYLEEQLLVCRRVHCVSGSSWPGRLAGETLAGIHEFIELMHDTRCEVPHKKAGEANSMIIRIEVADFLKYPVENF